ncbi:hypothetical protein NQ315_004064 [Exocentrus adspersus]|uniref:Uncharacterized protein n=1 Tax=Exocentrus adspersus TaxID=1586481 RepID=A0AAV8W7V9_9CUCU|nr:hypothetical protein NQ315_004064 [Exocentrus adspersus]
MRRDGGLTVDPDPLTIEGSQGPWNKTSTSSYTSASSIKKDSPAGIPKYDLTFGRSRNDLTKKVEDDKSISRITNRYGSSYGTGYQRDTTPGYSGRLESSRIKPILDKKDTLHPPVSYRPLTRTGSRSRDPSPVEKSEKSTSSSSSYSYNRLYPKPYQSTSTREKSESISPSRTIPKYVGRTSTGRDEIPRYTGRSSISKEDSISLKYGKASSREDLSSGSQKYINSRFLPKNAVEKSYTAHARPSTIRTNEASRKNRELLSVLHAQQEQERLSRSSSRCSSLAQDDSFSKETTTQSDKKSEPVPVEQIEMETVTVITRGTSPTPVTAQTSSYLRSRRIEIAKVVEKQITRPKIRTHSMADKEMQSDRLDDSTKTSRFAGASRISAWSSDDAKLTSSSNKQKGVSKSESSSSHQAEEKPKNTCHSPKSLSRNNSSKSINQCSKSDKSKEVKKSPSPAKSKIVPPKQISSDKKQLPPQIPKSEAASKPNSLHSFQTANKDFRKSVLNMNADKSKNKIGRRSNSASSADSDAGDPDATDVSENLTSCKSYHTSSSSKLPQKVSSSDKSLYHRCRRSPSSDASTSCHTSSSEEDPKTKHENIKRKSGNSSRTSVVVSSADELSLDKSPKPPHSPRQKTEGIKSEAEAKSFLMRALAPVTNLFKTKHNDSEERVNWMDPSSESNNEIYQNSLNDESRNASSGGAQNSHSVGVKNSGSGLIPAKIIIHRVESSETPWWLDEKSEDSKPNSPNSKHSSSPKQPPKENKLNKPSMRHVESGEIPWWLDETAEIPEGVQTYPNWVREDGTTEDGRVIYKIRKNESGDTSWWLSSSEKTDSNKQKPSSNIMDSEYLEKHKIRHIDSGERSWWLNSSENISEMVQAIEDPKQNQTKYAIRHQDSAEKAWWLQQNTTEEQKDSEYEFDQEQAPLGDRASPEGLETPKDDEGRQSPYDNVPSTQQKVKRPSQLSFFISRHTNIDDILGGSTQIWSPLMDRLYGYENVRDEECREIDAAQVIIHEGTPKWGGTQANRK